MDVVVEGAVPRSRPKGDKKEVVDRDMKSLKMLKKDALVDIKMEKTHLSVLWTIVAIVWVRSFFLVPTQ